MLGAGNIYLRMDCPAKLVCGSPAGCRPPIAIGANRVVGRFSREVETRINDPSKAVMSTDSRHQQCAQFRPARTKHYCPEFFEWGGRDMNLAFLNTPAKKLDQVRMMLPRTGPPVDLA